MRQATATAFSTRQASNISGPEFIQYFQNILIHNLSLSHPRRYHAVSTDITTPTLSKCALTRPLYTHPNHLDSDPKHPIWELCGTGLGGEAARNW
jgi:hypothetical protein